MRTANLHSCYVPHQGTPLLWVIEGKDWMEWLLNKHKKGREHGTAVACRWLHWRFHTVINCASCLLSACECVLMKSPSQSSSSFSAGKQYATVTTPNFPHEYSSGINCILYTIVADKTQLVEITFVEFDMAPPTDNRYCVASERDRQGSTRTGQWPRRHRWTARLKPQIYIYRSIPYFWAECS